MKTIVTFIILLFAVTGFAQERLINRVDPQLGEKSSRIEHRVTSERSFYPVCLDKSRALEPQAAEERSIEVTLLTPIVEIGKENYANVAIDIKNISAAPIKLVFERTQQIPEGWTTSVCDPNECHSALLDILPPEKAFTIEPGQHAEYHLAIASKTTPLPDTARVYLLFRVIESFETDTSGVFLIAATKPLGAVNGAIAQTQRPAIRAIYPSPLISGHSINVSVQSSKDIGYKYAIIDPFGREVAFGISQRKLTMGDNVIRISELDGLSSGSYMLRMTFLDGTSDTYPFRVVR